MIRTYKYRNRKTRETLEIRADFARADWPIIARWNGRGTWFGTPFQVSDTRHSKRNALRIVACWQS